MMISYQDKTLAVFLVYFMLLMIIMMMTRSDAFCYRGHLKMTTMMMMRDPELKNDDMTIYRQRLYGEWIVWHSTNQEFLNREVVHIYPNNKLVISYRYKKGPFLYHREKQGRYDIKIQDKESLTTTIDININGCKETLLSIYGVGIQDILGHLKTREIKYDLIMMDMNIHCVGPDDLYLSSKNNQENDYHLIRSVRINEPKIDIPISTFIFTQIIGTIISQILHSLFSSVFDSLSS